MVASSWPIEPRPLIGADICRWMIMATTFAPPHECTECGELVQSAHNGDLLHVDTDLIHCLWPRAAWWRRVTGRA